MNGFLQLLDALKAGQSLANAAAWKNRQATIAAVSAVLGGLLIVGRWAGLDLGAVSAEDVASLAGGVAAFLGLLNGYLTLATSDKVGIRAKELPGQAEPEPAGADNSAGSAEPNSSRANATTSLPTDGGL